MSDKEMIERIAMEVAEALESEIGDIDDYSLAVLRIC